MPVPTIATTCALSVLIMSAAIAQAQPAGATTATASATPSAPVLMETLVVSGEQPGPGMWRVSKGEHVLWIVGTQAPVPKRMTWRAKGVEAIVAQAQEVLAEPSLSVSTKQIGFFTTLWILPSAMEARKNPGGATLKDIVPADLYRRWLVLRDKYVGEYKTDDEENDIERWRPMFAALRLYSRAISSAGMSSANPVWPVVSEAAKKYRVKTTDVAFRPQINATRAAVNELASARLADIDCFAKTVERIETDLDAMRLRASAWAKGDIKTIRSLPATDQRAACEEAIRNASFMKTLGVQNFAARVENNWFAAADLALSNNKVTLAVLPIGRLLAADGYLAMLKARGYAVQEPESAGE